MSQNSLACPLCKGVIKKVTGGKSPMIKCEKNVFKNGQHSGCNFFMNLAPKPLNGYVFNKDEIKTMLDGGEIDINGITATYDIDAEFNPALEFPPMEDF